MAGQSTPVLLVTANVGSIFEDPSLMLQLWTEEFLSTISRLDPKFIALHCQEVGGKNYERSMKHVEYFVRLLMSSEELRLFDKVRVFLDEDYSSAENFTALGNFYFVHESVSDVLIWDFSAMSFVSAKGKEVHSGNIEAVSTKEKSKFPQDFFPECKWSRKGFLRARWSLNGSVFDLINIHLFHDASNFIAMESFPSVYCKNRRRALEHTLDRFHNDDYGTAPFFVFGDFNFRTDAQGVVKKLAEGLNPVRLQSNKSTDHTKLQYRDGTSQVILSLGKKEFSHQDHQTVFIEENGKWLREFDRELEPFADRLYEFPISFPPSYPFEEDRKGAECYMQTRCPSWCDRVLLSNSAKSLVSNINEPGSVQYGLMGANTCMGDHKPVYLKVSLDSEAGMIPCGCNSESSPCFGLYLPVDARVSPHWPKSHSQHSSRLDHAALSSMLLAARCTTTNPVAAGPDSHLLLPPPTHASLLHDPYTPESMETPSSSPTPSMTPQFEFADGYERENDTNLRIYEPAQSTKDKIYSWDFVVVDSGEHSGSPDDDVCEDDKTDVVSAYSNCKREESRKNLRPDIQEIEQFDSEHRNETLLLTEKFLSGSYTSSSVDILQTGNLNKKGDSVLTSCLSSEDEVHKQELIASDVYSTRHFQVPDIIEEEFESCSSLNRFPVSYSKSGKEFEFEKVPVSERVCFCDSDVHNNNMSVTRDASAECRDADQLTALSCDTGTVQKTSQVKGSTKSVQMISGFPSEAYDMLPLCQNHHHGVDAQILSQSTPLLVLETEIKSDVAQNFATLFSGRSVSLNPGMMRVQSALDIRGYADKRHTNSSQEMCSCSAEGNMSAVPGQSVIQEIPSPGSCNPIMTPNMDTTNESTFFISNSSDEIKYSVAIKNSLLSSESSNSVTSHKLNSCNNYREHLQNQTSKGRRSPCNKVFRIEPATVHDCTDKNLFRSASVPDIYSTRMLEKQIPCLFVSRKLSYGDINTPHSIQDFEDCPNASFENCGDKSALKQEPHAEQDNAISSIHSSVIETPVEFKQENKHDRKSSSEGKCYSCCILL